MLGDKHLLNLDCLHQWLHNTGSQDLNLSTPEMINLEKYLYFVLQTNPTPSKLNDTLIAKARDILNDMPYPLLAYSMIKSDNNVPLPLFNGNNSYFAQSFHLTDPKFQVLSLYTSDRFYPIYLQSIPLITQEIAQGNWVLGNKNKIELNQAELSELTQDVRDFYLTDYLNQWRQFLFTLRLN